MTPSHVYRLGVDGGGSRCRVRLVGESGQMLANAEGGSANVYLDFEGALSTIRAVVATAFAQAGLDRSAMRQTRAGLGLAGVSSPEVAARVEAALPGFQSIVVEHDGVAACLGAHAGQDGGIVIAGTGSVALLRHDKRVTTIGGRGFILGDDGSGAWIGREVLRRALRVLDGLEPSSPFAEALLDDHSRDPVALIDWARRAPSHAFAAYAPRVFEAALRGDTMARTVVHQAARAIGELIGALEKRSASHISLVGGMADSVEPYLPLETAAILRPPLSDPLSGALLLAAERPLADGERVIPPEQP